MFNDAYVGSEKSAVNFMGVGGWLTAWVKLLLYIELHFHFVRHQRRARSTPGGTVMGV